MVVLKSFQIDTRTFQGPITNIELVPISPSSTTRFDWFVTSRGIGTRCGEIRRQRISTYNSNGVFRYTLSFPDRT